MVFDAIYDEYEKRIIEEFKHSKSEEEIEDMLEAKEIHDIILKRLAKALAVAVYRNGKIEDIHAGDYDGPSDFNGIPDSCMKEINIDVCNKMYTMLHLLTSSDKEDLQIAYRDIVFSELCASEWNDPELDESLYFKLD